MAAVAVSQPKPSCRSPETGSSSRDLLHPRRVAPGRRQLSTGFDPVSLADAITTSPVEGSPMSVGYRRLLVSANGYDADISVFFGTKNPTHDDLNAAQDELTGLILPSSPTPSR